MLKKLSVNSLVMIVLVFGLLVGCGSSPAEVGTLEFKANGEDFVRQGFVSKDGWSISFDHVYLTLSEVTAYQSDPPYDAHMGGKVEASNKVGLEGTYTVDLAEGDENAAPILVGKVEKAPAGHYNAISWKMVPASDGPSSGYTLLLVGKAEKEGRVIDFKIGVEKEYSFTCGEFVGDERKGIVQKGGSADLEMTFHFDHIFGDAETPLDDDLNVAASGFEPFAGVAEGETLETDMAGLESSLSADDYKMLVDILPTLGHVGEGHCYSAEGSH